VSFDEYGNALLLHGLASHPSELQGGLYGGLCGGNSLSGENLLVFFSQLTEISAEHLKPLENELTEIYRDIQTSTDTGSGLIELLLPDDDQPLADRLDALSRWCRSFLVGLGLSGLSGDTQLSPDVTEAMRDLAEIALVDSTTEATEDAEASLTELIEFVRVAVSLIQVELAALMSVSDKRKH
jgi:hypothetical protein